MTIGRRWSRRAFLRGAAGALAAPGLLGCSRSPTGEDADGPARLAARPRLPRLSPVKGDFARIGLASPRDAYLYVPESYTPEVPMPLFVALHGATGSGSSWQSYPARAEAHGMIVLAPDSRSYTWDLVRSGFGADVAFLDDALAYTFERCRVDPDRLVLGGFSDGASYALSLGVANGDLFSHLIAYSPGFYSPGTPITGRPPIFVSHGTSDSVLSYARTSNVIVPQLEAAGYDVTFVSFDGDHGVPADISEAAIGWFLGE